MPGINTQVANFCSWKAPFFMSQVAVRGIQMENGGTCLKDYLEFKFSNQASFRICGGQAPSNNLAGTGPVNITFVTDAETNYNGFYLQYQGMVLKNGYKKFSFIVKLIIYVVLTENYCGRFIETSNSTRIFKM